MLINGRFKVDPSRNEITDIKTCNVNRVEPRLIKLLCLLTENEGKAVSRKIIIQKIWNDYPGGDEGLNQAISVLRKLMKDNKKTIIETLPKTGYCFHATIATDHVVSKKKSFKAIYVSVILLLLIVAFELGHFSRRENEKIVPNKQSIKESVKAFQMDSKGSIARPN